MTSYYLAPVGNSSQIDGNGNPLSAGTITTFQAGTNTPFPTYTDNAGGGSQVSILLNTQGLPSSPIWFIAGQAIKFVIKDSAGNLIRTVDNLQGINDPSFGATLTEWTTYSGAATFISATSFSVTGDQTNIFQVDRRVKSTNTGGAAYSTILSSAFSAGITTVTLANTSGVLDSGISQVSYGLLAALNTSYPNNVQDSTRIDVASATTVNLSTSAPNTRDINITGTTAITGFTVAVGKEYVVRFAGILTLTNGASLVIQSGANITTAAGDTCLIRATAANTVEVVCYTRAAAATQAQQEAGADLTVAVTPGRQQFHPSAAKVWLVVSQSAGSYTTQLGYNIASVTKTGTGVVEVTFTTAFSSTTFAPQVTCDGNACFAQYARTAANKVTISILRSSTEAATDAGFSLVVFGDQ